MAFNNLQKHGICKRKKHKRVKVNFKVVLLVDKDFGIKKYYRYFRPKSVAAFEKAGEYRAFQSHLEFMELLDKHGLLGK